MSVRPEDIGAGPAPAARASGVVRVTASTVEPRSVTFLDGDGRIPDGMLSLLVGEPGLGKSTYAYNLAARVSRRGEHVLFASAEDPLHEVWRPRLEAAGADLDRVHYVRLASGPDDERGLVLPTDVNALAADLAQVPARLLVVDPLGAHLSEATSAHVDSSVRQALAPLARLADDRRCAVLGVMHLNKNEMARGLARVGGSIAFVAAARSVLVWGNDPDADATEDSRVLGHLKCNVGRREGSLGYRVEPATVASGVETSRVVCTGDSPHTAEDVLSAQSGGDAKSFLNDYLAGGPRATKDVLAEAQDAGFTKDQIKTARKRLGVKATRVGGPGADGCWVLELPKGAKGVSHPDSPLSEIGSTNGNGWHPHTPDEDAPDWWRS